MYIALSDKLLKEFISYKGIGTFNKDLIQKLFNYLQPFVIGKYQKSLIDPSILKQFNGNSFISTSSAENSTDLINDTIFKIMLTDDNNFYPYINILNDEITVNFNAVYQSGDNRDKVIKHIRSLLENTANIEIIDSHLFPHFNSTQWNENFDILKIILPKKKIKIKFISKETAKQEHKTALKRHCSLWNSSYPRFNNNIHDRYIKTDKITILLSSGINYLNDIDKDLTYIIREQN